MPNSGACGMNQAAPATVGSARRACPPAATTGADSRRRRAGPEAAFRMVDIQSPMDIAALVPEKSAFFMALFEAPEAVLELADKVYQLLTAFLDEWFARYGHGFVAHFPDYYMPYGATLSEDEIGSVGPEMFSTCFRPYLVKLAERYGGLGIHCCAQARHHWGALRTIPNLRVLNLCQPREVAAEAYRYFAEAAVQMHGSLADTPPESWPGLYPPAARVVLEVHVAGDRCEAERTAAALRQLQDDSL